MSKTATYFFDCFFSLSFRISLSKLCRVYNSLDVRPPEALKEDYRSPFPPARLKVRAAEEEGKKGPERGLGQRRACSERPSA